MFPLRCTFLIIALRMVTVAHAAEPDSTAWYMAQLRRVDVNEQQRCTYFTKLTPAGFERALNAAPDDTDKYNILRWLAGSFHDVDRTLTVCYGSRAVQLADRMHWHAGRAQLDQDIGYAYNELGNYPEALDHLTQAIDGFTEAGDGKNAAEGQYYISNILAAIGDTSEALAHMERYLTLADSLGDPIQQVEALRGVGNIHRKFGDTTAALDHLQRAYRVAVQLRDTFETAMTLQEIAQVHLEQGELDKALAGFLQCRSLLLSYSRPVFLVGSGCDLGGTYAAMGRDAEALSAYEQALALSQRLSYAQVTGMVHRKLGSLLVRMHRAPQGISHLEEALGVSRRMGPLSDEVECLKELVDANRATGDLRKALAYTDLYLARKDSLHTITGQVVITRASARAAYHEMMLRHRSENERSRAAATAALQRTRSVRNIILVAAGLGLLIAALLVNRYRLKRRLQMAQLRTRLSRDLHDDIGSTLSSINILSTVAQKRMELSGDAASATSLAKISERSQRLMRNMSDIVWSVDPQKDSLEELVLRMREFAASMLEAKGIIHTFTGPTEVTARKLSPEMKNNLYLIFKEAIDNVVKHAEAKHVEVRMAIEGNTLRLTVMDDGVGMHACVPPNTHGGNGMRNMQDRAKEMNTEVQWSSPEAGGTVCALIVNFS